MLQTVLPVYCAEVCRASRDVNDLAGARPTKAETSKRLKPSLAQCLNAVIQVKFDVFFTSCVWYHHTHWMMYLLCSILPLVPFSFHAIFFLVVFRRLDWSCQLKPGSNTISLCSSSFKRHKTWEYIAHSWSNLLRRGAVCLTTNLL